MTTTLNPDRFIYEQDPDALRDITRNLFGGDWSDPLVGREWTRGSIVIEWMMDCYEDDVATGISFLVAEDPEANGAPFRSFFMAFGSAQDVVDDRWTADSLRDASIMWEMES